MQPVPRLQVLGGECEAGQQRACPGPSPRRDGSPIQMHCSVDSSGMGFFKRADCATPLVVSFDERPVTFTRPEGTFAIGPFERTEWISAETPWLALDLDGSGCIDDQRELFGPPEGASSSEASNGFAKLARLDGDRNGRIDANDAAYASLVLWFDRDQDRRCIPSELSGLAQAGVVALELGYAGMPTAPSGSYEGEHATTWIRSPSGAVRRGRLVDVYLTPL